MLFTTFFTPRKESFNELIFYKRRSQGLVLTLHLKSALLLKTSFCPSYFSDCSLSSLFFQAIHQQLQEALEEQESLKVQISEYARQVARVEELLAQKVTTLPFIISYSQTHLYNSSSLNKGNRARDGLWISDLKVHLTPKYCLRVNNSLHLFETHCAFLALILTFNRL